MKVLFVNRCLTGGGSERAMTMIANYFADQNIDVSMLLLNEEQRTYQVNKKVKIVECYCPIEGNKLLWHIRRIWTIRKALKANDAKTVITFMWDINMNVILAAVGLKKYIIASERCDPHHESRKLMKLAMKFVLPFAEHTVFQTPMVQTYYPGSVQRKSTVIPNAISEVASIPDRKSIDKQIVAVGRLVEQKNFKMLIEAFAVFHQRYPDYRLTIYGEGPLRQTLEHQIDMLQLSACVELPGYVNDVNDRMKHAALYVNSSDYEGISNAMLEAMALGLPCICTDCPVGGASMMIQDGVNGVLVPIGDMGAMVSAMIDLVTDNARAMNISREAAKVKNQFSIDEIGKKWLGLVQF